MDAQSRRVGRPRKNTHRVELRLNADDPMVAALVREAAARHVTLQQHITDILIARHLGQSAPEQAELPADVADTAAALAKEWLP